MKRLIAAAVLILCMVIPHAAFADSLNLTISGGKNVKTGETFGIAVIYSADDLDWVDGELSYNTSVLSYVSGGTSTGDGGVVSLREASDDKSNVVFKIKFKAIGSGNADISVTTSEAYDFGGSLLNLPQEQKTVKIEYTEEVVPDDQEEAEEEYIEETQDEEEVIEDVDRDVGPLNFYLICGTAITAFLLVILLCIAARRKRRNRI